MKYFFKRMRGKNAICFFSICILLILPVIASGVSWEDQFSLDTLNIDENGWSNLRPAADSRLIFVSNAGDDSAGQVYDMSNSSDATFIGSDPHNPSNEVAAFKTIIVAMKYLRSDKPDWLILKRGDEWIRDEYTNDFNLLYVDYETGNDTTGTPYLPGDTEIGSDIRDPLGEVKVYKNQWYAAGRVPADAPYLILTRSADKWNTSLTRTKMTLRTGRSPSERSVITYYGSDPARPLVKTGMGPGLSFSNGKYSAVIGISFYANKRDPNSPDFTKFEDVSLADGFFMYSFGSSAGPIKSILIEDCVFNFYSGNSITDAKERLITDIIIRRSQILNSYNAGGGMSQGIIAPSTSLLLEENLFEHNGWFQKSDSTSGRTGLGYYDNEGTWIHTPGKAGQATVFNHNTYLGYTQNTIFRGNIFSRESSLNTKFVSNSPKIYYAYTNGVRNSTPIPEDDLDQYEHYGEHIIIKPGIITAIDTIGAENLLVDNNFYFGGEVAMSIGGNWDWNTGYRFQNMNVTNNVLANIGRAEGSNGRTTTDRSIGWGMEIKDWDGGVISNNYLLNYGDSIVTDTYGISLAGHLRNVDVYSNVIAGIAGNGTAIRVDGAIETLHGGPKDNLRIFDNKIWGKINTQIIDAPYASPGTFFDNTYYSERSADSWFSMPVWEYVFMNNGSDGIKGTEDDYWKWRWERYNQNFSTWKAATDDTSVVLETAPDYTNPNVSLAGYNVSIGGVGTAEAFLEEAKKQSRHNWDQRYTATAVNNYFRAGMEPKTQEGSANTVTPSASANGSIFPASAQTISTGITTYFTVTSAQGYTASVTGTCGGNLSGTIYTTNSITTDCTVVAQFYKDTDTDGDGILDINDPDDDNDGLPDSYENQYSFLNPLDDSDAALDQENDGLTNLQEYQAGADPTKKDTDRDGLSDKYELDNNLNPTDGICPTWICSSTGWRHAIQSIK